MPLKLVRDQEVGPPDYVWRFQIEGRGNNGRNLTPHLPHKRALCDYWDTRMTKAAFDKIAEGLQEALAVAKGKAKPFKVFGMPVVINPSIPDNVIEFRHPDGRKDRIELPKKLR